MWAGGRIRFGVRFRELGPGEEKLLTVVAEHADGTVYFLGKSHISVSKLQCSTPHSRDSLGDFLSHINQKHTATFNA